MSALNYEIVAPGVIEMEIPKTTNDRPKFKLTPASELTEKPKPIDWLIKGVIERESIGMVFGPPANGKSLIVLDWGFCCAAGRDWEGRPTKKTAVVILAGEGHAGYARRLKALEQKYRLSSPNSLLLSDQSAQLDDSGSCDDVVKAIQETGLDVGLVVVDTLNRNFASDENSSKDVAVFISNLERFFKPLGAAVIVVHHSGHNESGRSRGSSALRGAMDAEYQISKSENIVSLSCTKAKDFEPLKPLDFALKQVQLNWQDDDGQPLTSVHLEFTGEAINQPKKTEKPKLTAREDQILQSLTDALKNHGIEPTSEMWQKFAMTGTGTFSKVVKLEDWREYAYKAIPTEDSKDPSSLKRNTLKRFKDKFLGSYLMEHDDYVWRIDTEGVTNGNFGDTLLNSVKTPHRNKRNKQ